MFLRYQIKEDEIVEAFIALKRGQKLWYNLVTECQ
jgi:hypothetical protein